MGNRIFLPNLHRATGPAWPSPFARYGANKSAVVQGWELGWFWMKKCSRGFWRWTKLYQRKVSTRVSQHLPTSFIQIHALLISLSQAILYIRILYIIYSTYMLYNYINIFIPFIHSSILQWLWSLISIEFYWCIHGWFNDVQCISDVRHTDHVTTIDH